jgi:hypothetical protein
MKPAKKVFVLFGDLPKKHPIKHHPDHLLSPREAFKKLCFVLFTTV